MKRVLVTGAAGFVGGHLVKRLVSEGYHVVGVDIKEPEFEPSAAQEFVLCDLRDGNDAYKLLMHYDDTEDVYALAADMGGMEYLHGNHDTQVMRNNTLINLNTLFAAHNHGVKRYFFASSACVYPEYRQLETHITPLREQDAYPAHPDLEYGWEKLYAERVALAFARDYGLNVRIARFHNTYGEFSDYDTERAKAPAALCRKVAYAKLMELDSISVFGDGQAVRSYTYIDDCIEGITRLMDSAYKLPVNLGSDEIISVDGLARLIMEIAGVDLEIKHDLSKPQGVRGRNSDNTLIQDVLAWQPSISLREGIGKMYAWVEKQVARDLQKA